jgi:hypothetical protein
LLKLFYDELRSFSTFFANITPHYFENWKPGWLNELGSWITSLSPIRRGFAPGFVNYKKGALDYPTT